MYFHFSNVGLPNDLLLPDANKLVQCLSSLLFCCFYSSQKSECQHCSWGPTSTRQQITSQKVWGSAHFLWALVNYRQQHLAQIWAWVQNMQWNWQVIVKLWRLGVKSICLMCQSILGFQFSRNGRGTTEKQTNTLCVVNVYILASWHLFDNGVYLEVEACLKTISPPEM